MWSIDGSAWDIPCKIERSAEITSSEISGMLLNKQYFNDVLGTWMKYTVSLAIPKGMEAEYSALYDKLVEPVDGHVFVFPYNQHNITITGRINVVSDQYVKLPHGANTWRYTKFDVIANHPSKTMNASDVISVGLTQIPDVEEAEEGTLYEMTEFGWTLVEYENAEDNYY